ncbi:MAG: hypothetical protein IJA67_05210 [Oscillospiraceae bacterium]|nr:hypothetical protein [Oscillospiraceae bacterium]
MMLMKKITFNALLNHKAHNYKPMQIEVEKVIPLYGKRFEQMKNHPLDDCPEIIENRDLMYMKGNTAHCILFLDANGNDGILVEAEGADYARKSQFISNARAIVEANDITTTDTASTTVLPSAVHNGMTTRTRLAADRLNSCVNITG